MKGRAMTKSGFLRDVFAPDGPLVIQPQIAQTQAGILIHDMTQKETLIAVAPIAVARVAVAPIASGALQGSVPNAPLANQAMAPDIFVAAGTTASALQSVIKDAAAGSVIHLAAGHFSFDRSVTIARDDITVIGAGSDQTIIDVAPALGAEAFRVGQGNTTGSFTLAADVKQGSTVLTPTGAHSFAVGDFMYLARASTNALLRPDWRHGLAQYGCGAAHLDCAGDGGQWQCDHAGQRGAF